MLSLFETWGYCLNDLLGNNIIEYIVTGIKFCLFRRIVKIRNYYYFAEL